jgi:hypothetical protein
VFAAAGTEQKDVHDARLANPRAGYKRRETFCAQDSLASRDTTVVVPQQKRPPHRRPLSQLQAHQSLIAFLDDDLTIGLFMLFLDDGGPFTGLGIPLDDGGAFTVAVPIVTGADRYTGANRTHAHTDTSLFRTGGGSRQANARGK